MKGKVTFGILKTLAEAAADAGDLFAAFLVSGYGASYSHIQYEAAKRRQGRLRGQYDLEQAGKIRRRYSSVLYKLKRDNLISTDRDGTWYAITTKGKKVLSRLLKRKKDILPPVRYLKERSTVFTVVSFDIPERERRKRDWLRTVLKNLGLTMVHKSVWMGKVKIPREFLHELAGLKLVEYVEIFEITKTGSLTHLS